MVDFWLMLLAAIFSGLLSGLFLGFLSIIGVKGYTRRLILRIDSLEGDVSELSGKHLSLVRKVSGTEGVKKRDENRTLEEEAASRLRSEEPSERPRKSYPRPSVVTGR